MDTSASRRPPLDRTSPIPLYFQIAENLKEAIEAGTIAPGERLDNELELAEQLGVSRPTVRQAIQRLGPQGLLGRPPRLRPLGVAPRTLPPVALARPYRHPARAPRAPTPAALSL